MLFYSTKNPEKKVNLADAVLKSIDSDGGLYFPKKIPKLPSEFFKNLPDLTFQEIAFEVAKQFFTPEISEKELKQIIKDTYDFPVPLINLNENNYILELFHGPTLAFKDFGARFMARVVSKLISVENKKYTILVATSGDTGSAVAQGFYNIPNINVILLYPSKKVSKIQEKQLTTIGGNIIALEVKGAFDDCQAIVKKAFSDLDFEKNNIHLTSANSINIARLLPQSFYYFYAYAQLKKKNKTNLPLYFSVPSGNLGNLTAGLIAKKMGLPIKGFICSCNINDVFPEYLKTENFKPINSKKTISNAMDVGNPNNFPRIMELYKNNFSKIKSEVIGFSFTDKKTKEKIFETYQKYNYLSDPHTAVALLGAKKLLSNHSKNIIISLGTAHPSKFTDILKPIIGKNIKMPESLIKILKKIKKSMKAKANYEEVKKLIFYINSNFST